MARKYGSYRNNNDQNNGRGDNNNYQAPPPGRYKKRGRGFFGTIFYWGAVVGLWLAVIGVLLFIWVASDLPNPEELWKKTDRPSITYVDVNGQVIDRRGAADAPPVDLKTLPKYVPEAVMAVEDRKFYHHFGIDPLGLMRAMVVNIKAGHVVQGGSTLTQQLAKNLFLSSDQNLKRKAQEVLLALWLESRFSKDEIMSLYLARVYFGAGTYGITEASERYFNKAPSQLSISEAALLAGMLKAPSKYNPVSSSKRAAERATVVLDIMEKEGVITHEQRLQAVKQPLRFVTTGKTNNNGYFLDWIEPSVGAIIDEPKEDIIVETTLSLKDQQAAQNAIDKEFNQDGKQLNMSQAALVAIAGDGGVRAMVGGRNYNESEFNRVTTAKRQPGSAFKPFIYLAALEKGDTPYSIRIDKPIKIGDWQPSNYNNRFGGAMTLMSAFAHSTNTIAVQLGEEVGRDTVIRVARRLGVRSRIDPDPTLALGTQVMTPMELTGAYVPFSNGGAAVTPYGFKRIRTRSGKILWEKPAVQPRRVIEDSVLRNMNMMLRQVVIGGTSRSAALPDRMVGGKSGTTSDYRDAWFIGFTGGYTAGIWVGNDDYGQRMNRVTGGSAPARIWHNFMLEAMKGVPAKDFLLPAAPVTKAIEDASVNAVAADANDAPMDEYDDSGVATVEGEGAEKATPAEGEKSVNKPAASSGTSSEAASPKSPKPTTPTHPETKSIDQIVREVDKKEK